VIYPQLLRSDFEKLPPVLRDFHAVAGHRHASGRVSVRRTSAWAAILGFPPAGDNLPAQLDVFATDDREVWTRQFGRVLRRSRQWIQGEHLVEAAGPVRVTFRVFLSGESMEFESVGARLLGIPLPLHVSATVRGAGAGWEFEVRIAAIGSYRGVMEARA
jgi:hypothetical protein